MIICFKNSPNQKNSVEAITSRLIIESVEWAALLFLKPLLTSKWQFIGVFSVVSLISGYANALPSDALQPIRLLADKATYSERTGVTSYSGDVTITQGTLKLAADNITVNLSNGRSIESAVATGRPATMQQVVTKEKGLARGQANKIDYNALNGIVTLSGNAKLTQNGASFSGNVIRYSLKVGDVEATAGGSQRVELILPPNAQTSRSGIR